MTYLGIDIGGTMIKAVLIDGIGDVVQQGEFPTEDGEGAIWKEKIRDIIEQKTLEFADGDSDRLMCGISAPGLVDAQNRMTLYMPERLQGIENYDWSTELNREVWALNDGHSACLAEYETHYRSAGVRHLLMLTLGTGVGGGIIADGRLYQGNLQRAGHVGHMTVDYKGPPTMTNMPGSLEYGVGNFSIRERTDGQFASVLELVKAYEAGDQNAKTCWLESVEKLAVALASLTNILSPEVIVLGGGIAAGAGESLMKPLAAFMDDCEWRPGGNLVKVALAQHGHYAGAIGAALFAKTKDNPTN